MAKGSVTQMQFLFDFLKYWKQSRNPLYYFTDPKRPMVPKEGTDRIMKLTEGQGLVKKKKEKKIKGNRRGHRWKRILTVILNSLII